MRNFIIFLCLFLVSIEMNAQYVVGSPPPVEWSKTDIWPTEPISYTPPASAVPAEKSGEDWFLSVKVRHDATTKEPIGYLCGGYMTDPALNATTLNSLTTMGGNGTQYMKTYCGILRLHDLTGLSGYDSIVSGILMPAITVLDLNGDHSPTDYKRFETHGEFKTAIPTSDGGYLATGYTFYSSKLNYVSGSLSSISPIYYNPVIGQPLVSFETASNGGNAIPFPGLGAKKSLVVKYNSDLSVAWYYTYGTMGYTAGPSNPAFYEGGEITSAVECVGGGFLVGGGTSDGGPFYKKIDNNGKIVWSGQVFSPTVTSASLNSMDRTIENGNEVFYVTGNYPGGSCYVSKIDASGAVLWTTYHTPGTTHDVSSIAVASDGNIFIGGLADPSWPGGYGFVCKINSSTGALLYSYVESFLCKSADLRYAITATSNGGCAAIGTIIKDPVGCSFSIPLNYAGTPTMCGPPPFIIWNSDAYVAQFDATLNKIWSTTFDAATDTPGGTALDILSGCTSCGGSCPLPSWEIPNQLGLDVTRRECMFGITEAPDRSIVIAGKNGRNLDDCYLVKLECESQSTPLSITNVTISGTERHKAGAIEVSNNVVAASTSRITMDACRYILFDDVTTITSGSVISATVASYNCCNSSPGGMRVATKELYETELQPGSSSSIPGINVSIFPNPNNGAFTVTLETTKEEVVYLEVIDPMGKTVSPKKELFVNGQLNTDMSLIGYRKGIYAVKVYAGKTTQLKKVIVE